MNKKAEIWSIVLGVIVVSGIVLYSGSAELFQGRVFKTSEPLPAYDENKCYDSDGGKNYEEAGTIYGKLSRSEFGNKTDVCTTRTKVKEYFCNAKFIQSEEYNCENGCSKGSCVEVYAAETVPEGGEQCRDYIDNDEDGFFDCYDSGCSGVKDESGYSYCFYYKDIDTYSGAGIYILSNHDRIKFGDGLIAEVDQLQYLDKEEKVIVFKLYYEEGKQIIAHPAVNAAVHFLPEYYPYTKPGNWTSEDFLNGLVGMHTTLPFFSLNGAYVYLKDVDVENKQVTVEVFDSCNEVYDKCMIEPNLNGNFDQCKRYACPYEAFDDSYEVQETSDFKVVYPKVDKVFADTMIKYLPGCYEGYVDLFGGKQNIDQLTVFLNNGVDGADTVKGVADGDRIDVQYDGLMSEIFPYEMEDEGKACGVKFYPLAHEMGHVFHFWTAIPPDLTEGFANYAAGKVNGKDEYSYLVCLDTGYYINNYFIENGTKQPDVTLYEDSNNFYEKGECFWQLLEKEYGWDKVAGVIKKMGTLRNIPKAGDASYSFYDDVLLPVLGGGSNEFAENLSAKLDLKTDCSFKIGQYYGEAANAKCNMIPSN